jgi:hypothetical protein
MTAITVEVSAHNQASGDSSATQAVDEGAASGPKEALFKNRLRDVLDG